MIDITRTVLVKSWDDGRSLSHAPRLELRRSVVTSQTAEAIFSTLCNLAAAPNWLPNCTAMVLLDEESVGVGSRLRYSFRELGYAGSLSCSVVAFIPGQRIAIAFSDARIEASIDFVIDEREGTTTIHHTVMLLPKSLAVRMLARMIRRALPGRMDAALRGLEQAALKNLRGRNSHEDPTETRATLPVRDITE